MATDTEAADDTDPSIDHLRLDDGTYVLFDPEVKQAWLECDVPVDLASAT
jgi:hypothetical protein